MDDDSTAAPQPARSRRVGLRIVLVGTGIVAGAVGATAAGAYAQTDNSGSASRSSSASSSAPGAPQQDRPGGGHGKPGGAGPIRSDEKSLSAALTAKLKAAALKAVPGGKVYRVESDAGDGTYEAHMTKANGDLVTVKFAKDLSVKGVESGMGKGDPAPSR